MSMSETTSSATVELTKEERLRQTLTINRFESECGNCGKGADPREEYHKKQLGWGDHEPHGCGVKWLFVTSDYSGMEDRVREMRPDLEWYNRWGG